MTSTPGASSATNQPSRPSSLPGWLTEYRTADRMGLSSLDSTRHSSAGCGQVDKCVVPSRVGESHRRMGRELREHRQVHALWLGTPPFDPRPGSRGARPGRPSTGCATARNGHRVGPVGVERRRTTAVPRHRGRSHPTGPRLRGRPARADRSQWSGAASALPDRHDRPDVPPPWQGPGSDHRRLRGPDRLLLEAPWLRAGPSRRPDRARRRRIEPRREVRIRNPRFDVGHPGSRRAPRVPRGSSAVCTALMPNRTHADQHQAPLISIVPPPSRTLPLMFPPVTSINDPSIRSLGGSYGFDAPTECLSTIGNDSIACLG